MVLVHPKASEVKLNGNIKRGQRNSCYGAFKGYRNDTYIESTRIITASEEYKGKPLTLYKILHRYVLVLPSNNISRISFISQIQMVK